jgi:hypothetical protein
MVRLRHVRSHTWTSPSAPRFPSPSLRDGKALYLTGIFIFYAQVGP